MVFIQKEKGLLWLKLIKKLFTDMLLSEVGNICSYNTHECTISNKTIFALSFLKTHENLFTGMNLWYVMPLH